MPKMGRLLSPQVLGRGGGGHVPRLGFSQRGGGASGEFAYKFTFKSIRTTLTVLPRPVVFNLFCSRTHRYNFSSTLYPKSCSCIIQVIHSP
jgi:hypothetical protein